MSGDNPHVTTPVVVDVNTQNTLMGVTVKGAEPVCTKSSQSHDASRIGELSHVMFSSRRRSILFVQGVNVGQEDGWN